METIYSELNGKTVLITGATGLVCKTLIRKIRTLAPKTRIIALVRNLDKAVNTLGTENEYMSFLYGDVCTINPKKMEIDYIIHAASQTSSKAFVNEPVETIMTAINGTRNMLEIARLSQVKGFIYLSSMEVYGTPSTDQKVSEEKGTDLNTMKVRSCYPESKRMCESLCASYYNEYKVPARVIRLTQTFGPGVKYDDGRVFAEFARCVIKKRNIILKTKGETKRNYLYTEDAADAIVTVMLRGKNGEAYNAANEETYCSIYEMACMVAQKCADDKIKVVIDEQETAESLGYAPVLHMNLDTTKLQLLGWSASFGLEDMYRLMIEDMK